MNWKNLSSLKRYLEDGGSNQALWLAAVIVCGFLAYYWDATREKVERPGEKDSEAAANAATFIPTGFVLVPIEIANYESLDSILGNFGIVDLYIPSDDPRQRPRKVAKRVKILRAPLNPNRFAVLVSEADSPRLVTHPGPFTVVVQNPTVSGTGIVTPSGDSENSSSNQQRRKRSRIQIEVMNHDAG